MSVRNATTGFHSLPFRLSTILQSSIVPATSSNPTAASSSIRPFTPIRSLHKTIAKKPVPKPTPFVPDTKTFLSLIGRGMSKYASKLESWDDLFSMSSEKLRDDVGMVAARERRYLLRWLERFRQGRYGVGGDLDHVDDGVALLKVIHVPEQKMPGYKEKMESIKTREKEGGGDSASFSKPKIPTAGGTIFSPPGTRYAIVNIPNPPPEDLTTLPVKKYTAVRLHNGYSIRAPFIELLKAEGGGAHGMQGRLAVQEGMWEDKMGKKIDGGERNRDGIRAKRRAEERRAKEAAAEAAAKTA